MGETGVVCNVSCLAFWRRTSRDASTAGWSSCFPIMMDTVVANCWRRALSESSVKVMVGGGSKNPWWDCLGVACGAIGFSS